MARTKKTARKPKADKKKRKEMATKSAQKPKPTGGKPTDAGSSSTATAAVGDAEPTVETTTAMTGEETSDQPPSSGGEARLEPSSDQPPAENGPDETSTAESAPTETQEHEEKATDTAGAVGETETGGATKEE